MLFFWVLKVNLCTIFFADSSRTSKAYALISSGLWVCGVSGDYLEQLRLEEEISIWMLR